MVEYRKSIPSRSAGGLGSHEDWLDRSAVVVSALCLIHCLALPLALAALPALSAGLGTSELLHRALLFVILPTSGGALWLAWVRRRNLPAILAGGAGLCLIAWGATQEGAGELLPTVAGSLLLVWGHVLNWRSRRAVPEAT